MRNKKGFILLLTFIFMTVLTVIVGAMMYMVTYETRGAGSQGDDVNLSVIADAGIEKAHRAIRDDYLTTTSQSTGDLRGDDTTLSVSVNNPNNMRYVGGGNAGIDDNADQAILRTFDSNYTNTRIISISVVARAARPGGGGAGAVNPTMEVAYTTDGTNYTAVLSVVLTNSSLSNYTVSLPSSLSWSTIMSSNFRLRVRRTAGNRSINLDALYLRITYGIDTLNESWATGSYASFPITLGNGTIESITITDESGKVHLNYASQSLLANLLTNLSISNAGTKATAIVNYRGASLTNPFDSIEELQQVSGITSSDYNTIKDYVTAYSFTNSNVYRPDNPPPRAPININTASNQALKSVFDSSGLGAGDAQSLANDIITQRNTSPFKGLYSAASAVGDNTYFYNFVINRSYLSTSGNPDERDRAMDTADASSLIPVSGSNAYSCPTTELCYAGNVFHVNTLAQVGTRKLRLKTLVGNDGSRSFATYVGDTTLSGWRKENFE